METRDFAYWLQGFVEVTNASMTHDWKPTDAEWQVIKDHVEEVGRSLSPQSNSLTVTAVDSSSHLITTANSYATGVAITNTSVRGGFFPIITGIGDLSGVVNFDHVGLISC